MHGKSEHKIILYCLMMVQLLARIFWYHEFLILREIIWTSDVCFYMKTKLHTSKHIRRAAVRFQCKSLNSTGNTGHRTSASNVLCWPVKRFLWRNWFCQVCDTYTFLFVSPRVPIICRINKNLTKTCLVCSIWLKGINVPQWHISDCHYRTTVTATYSV